MRLVIDTNIIFSALLRKNARELQILQNQHHEIFYCQLSTVEIFKHKEKIVAFSNLSEKEMVSSYNEVLKYLRPVYERDIPVEIRKQAVAVCEDIDLKDVVFVAAAIMLDAYLWTGDEKLRKGLAKRGYTNTISTTEILKAD